MTSRPGRFLCVGWSWRLFLAWLCLRLPLLAAADLSQAQQHFLRGDYADCISACDEAIGQGARGEEWPLLLAKSQVTVGRYPDAIATVTNALARYRSSIRLWLIAHEVFQANGQSRQAQSALNTINELGGTRMWAYRDPANLTALGQAALLLGADAKLVLERFFDEVKKADPKHREVYLASGGLALEKADFELAAKTFTAALKQYPEDPDLHHGLARAYAPSSRPDMLQSLQTALKLNPRHVPSLLLLADHQIDGEQYAAAEGTLEKVLAVNPWQPEAWAYRAVLKHLQNQPDDAALARQNGLRFAPANPRVDHLLGRKLSQKYRFAEGAAHQRQALGFDASFIPAKIQLAQDLLRLGEETDGWRLAQEVHARDGYDVTAYNLANLHDKLAKFQTVTNRDFIVRMNPQEAALYGDRALVLLQRAREQLSAKYGLELEQPTIVEIFPEQKDFAVRTFGMPDNPGFLGVCFGRVVTANSPASHTARPSNWEAVLWHEFAHVITLQMTRNKMPRWLSEGISVYEECHANPAWGQHMNPQYREMILEGALTPVGQLSAAFLAPKTGLHLQFAYYQSYLVVEFLVERYGFDRLKAVLRDLGDGCEINQAIAAHTAPMSEVETGFVRFARERAEQLAPGLDWEKPKKDSSGSAKTVVDLALSRRNQFNVEAGSTNKSEDTVERPTPSPPALLVGVKPRTATAPTPTNFWVLVKTAQQLIEEEQWEKAKAPLLTLLRLYPAQRGPESAYAMLARAHRNLNETPQESDLLARWADLDADAVEAYLRLMELATVTQDWTVVSLNAERCLAVNPLLPQPHRSLAQACEALGEIDQALAAWRRVLLLDPPDPAEAHFRLARLLHQRGDASARRHVLQALEEAPRFREAHRLLLELNAVSARAAGGRAAPGSNSAEESPTP